jgi:hypothetical protein
MGGNPYGPLTTTNSLQELIMADANLKARPEKREHPSSFHMTLSSLAERPETHRPCIPWMEFIDRHIELFGFKPGERVYLSFDFSTRQISICPDFG